MLAYPTSTTREEKMEMVCILKSNLLSAHGNKILAIGVYGSLAIEKDGPYSDIELHVITDQVIHLKNTEFVYDRFKIEISLNEKNAFIEKAKEVHDSWAIKAGSFIHILPVHDPTDFFQQVKHLPFELLDSHTAKVLKDFMVWEPYETIAKIRNNYLNTSSTYMVLGANDLLWQTVKMIGLVNKTYYSTRAKTYEASLELKSIPSGYRELLQFVMKEPLNDKEKIYCLCENLWSGLNRWYEGMGLDYRLKELPQWLAK